MMMSEEEKIQKIIRLKRHERPQEGYFEDFLDEFQDRRQRESRPESSRPGITGLARWLRRRKGPGWVLGSGLAYAALLFLMVWWPKGVPEDSDANRQPVIYKPGSESQAVPTPPEKTTPDSKF